MNKKIKRLLQSVLLNKVCWKIISPFVWLGERAKVSRRNYIETPAKKILEEKAWQIFEDRIVKYGPFKGMYFGNARTDADSVFAKLLGSYESELHPVFERLLQKHYKTIIDIGCEDGYYAVGMCLRKPDVRLLAFDKNPAALIHSEELAKMNRVDHQIQFLGICTDKDLLELKKDEPMFLVVDCEGDELHIFTSSTVSQLLNADMLIELHLHIYPQLEIYFRNLFGETHNISVINSLDDHLKALNYDMEELHALDYATRRFIVGERDVFMQWILLESKQVVL
jgi:Methyltransferase small domain